MAADDDGPPTAALGGQLPSTADESANEERTMRPSNAKVSL